MLGHILTCSQREHTRGQGGREHERVRGCNAEVPSPGFVSSCRSRSCVPPTLKGLAPARPAHPARPSREPGFAGRYHSPPSLPGGYGVVGVGVGAGTAGAAVAGVAGATGAPGCPWVWAAALAVRLSRSKAEFTCRKTFCWPSIAAWAVVVGPGGGAAAGAGSGGGGGGGGVGSAATIFGGGRGAALGSAAEGSSRSRTVSLGCASACWIRRCASSGEIELPGDAATGSASWAFCR